MKNNSVTMFVAVVFVVGIVMWISVGIANAQTGIYDITERFFDVPENNLRFDTGNLSNFTRFRFVASEDIRKIETIRVPFVKQSSNANPCRIDQLEITSGGNVIYTQNFTPYKIENGNITADDGISENEATNINLWSVWNLQTPISIKAGDLTLFKFSHNSVTCRGAIVGDTGSVTLDYNGSVRGRTGLYLGGLNLYPALNLTGTSSDTIRASVISSVQDTTAPLVPVAGAMVGIPVAFVIGRRLISIIRLMI